MYVWTILRTLKMNLKTLKSFRKHLISAALLSLVQADIHLVMFRCSDMFLRSQGEERHYFQSKYFISL